MIRGFPSEGVNQRRRSLVVNENSVRAENAKISSACRHSLLEKLIEVSVWSYSSTVVCVRAPLTKQRVTV
jgi:hypothetical protein